MDLSHNDERARAMKFQLNGGILNTCKLANDRGVALIVVLWIFIFLFVVAFDFSSSVREEAAAANRYSDETLGYYLAIAGFEQGLYNILSQAADRAAPQSQRRSDPVDGVWREENFGGGVYRVRLVDEGGKININRVNEDALRRIFTNLGIEEPRRSILVDSIMDWRDPDDLHRVSGAENDYYLSLQPSYTAKNGLFDTVEDLFWVRGMTAELFHGSAEANRTPGASSSTVGLREIFTVDSPIDRVNLRTASAEVIHALMGMPLEKSRAFVEERSKLSDRSLGDLLRLLGIGSGDTALQMFIFTNASVVAIEAEGHPTGSQGARRVKGIVRLGGGQQGFELLRWMDREWGYRQEPS
jgi:general secretion pathway protein K